MRKIELSIIVLSYSTKELLERCLESVVKELGRLGRIGGDEGSEGFEVIVVDNGSTDGSVEMVRKLIEKYSRSFVSGTGKLSKKEELRVPLIRDNSCNQTIKLIENRANLGFAKGNNRAVQEVRGELVLFLNSDTVVKEGAIEKLVGSMKKNEEKTAVCPLLLKGDGTIQKDPCYLKFPNPLRSVFYYNSILRKQVSNFFPQLLYSTSNFSTSSEVDQLPGAAFVIRKSDFLNIGGFDESFSHFFEDVDLSWRLKEKGFKFFLIPEAEIVHFGGKSLEPKIKKEGVESFYYLNFKSLFKFCEKHYSPVDVFLIKAVVCSYFLARLRFSLINKLFFQ